MIETIHIMCGSGLGDNIWMLSGLASFAKKYPDRQFNVMAPYNQNMVRGRIMGTSISGHCIQIELLDMLEMPSNIVSWQLYDPIQHPYPEHARTQEVVDLCFAEPFLEPVKLKETQIPSTPYITFQFDSKSANQTANVDPAILHKITEHYKAKYEIVDVSSARGKPLAELAYIIKHAVGHVGAHSGMAHLALALKKPVHVYMNRGRATTWAGNDGHVKICDAMISQGAIIEEDILLNPNWKLHEFR